MKRINQIFSIILISTVSTFYIANSVLADPINFGDVEGQAIYNEQDNKLYYNKQELDPNNLNKAAGNYKIKNPEIQNILKKKSFNYNASSNIADIEKIIVNDLQSQISGDGKENSDTILLYHDGSSKKKEDSVVINSGLNEIKDSFIAVNMEFEAPNKNVFIAKEGFSSEREAVGAVGLNLFAIFNVGANDDRNFPNFLKATKPNLPDIDNNEDILLNNGAILLSKFHILSEGNKLKNMFLTDNGSIYIFNIKPDDTTPPNMVFLKDTKLISSNDIFDESYAKTTSANSINFNKTHLLIDNDISKKAFFNATEGVIDIFTYLERINNGNTEIIDYGSITIKGTNPKNKINGFAKGKSIFIETGDLTIFVNSIGQDNNFIEAKEVANVTVNTVKFSLIPNSNASLEKSFIKGKNVSLTIKNLILENVVIAQGQYLLEAEESATLNIDGYVNNDLANKFLDVNMMKGATNKFSGFKFDGSEEVNLTIADIKKIAKGELTITEQLVLTDKDNANLAIENLDYTKKLGFNSNIVKNKNGDATLTINGFTGTDISKLAFNDYLVEATNKATLNINGYVNNDLANKFLSVNMMKGATNEFSGFKFDGSEEVNLTIADTGKIGANLTVTDSLVSVTGKDAKVFIDNFNSSSDLTFDKNVVETKGNGNVELTINGFTGNPDILKIKGNLIEASGKATLNIVETDYDFLNTIISEKIKSEGDVQINIGKLDLKNKNFNHYCIKNSNIKSGSNIEVSFEGIESDEETEITGLIGIESEQNLSVILKSDFVFKGKEINGLIYNYIDIFNSNFVHDINFNFDSRNKKLNLNNTKIVGSLVYSQDGSAGLLDNNGNLIINKSSFESDGIALVYSHHINTIISNGKVILGNFDGDIYINELTVSDDSYINTSLMYIEDNGRTKTGTIKAKSFNLINSKIGAIVINDNVGTNNIEIISRENLKISQNEFLKSFVISGAEDSIIIIASGDKYDTNITKNTIHKKMITKKDIVIGNTNSKLTSFSENKAKNGEDLDDYILKTYGNGSIKILGKSIEIKGNDTSDSANFSYGLFKTINGSINIGDDNTEEIVVTENKTKDSVGVGVYYDVALMMTDSGDINFKAKNKIDFNLERNIADNNYYSKALMTTDGNINFKSGNLSIAGNSLIKNTDESNLEKFASGKKLILDINSTNYFLGGISIRNITLKTGSDIFFDFEDGIKIVSNNFNNKIYGLKSQNNGFTGAIFRNEKGKIYLKLKNLDIFEIDTPSVWLFKEADETAENIISIDKIEIKEDVKMAGFYYSNGKNFKMNGYDITNGYINFEYKGNITKMAAIKFGSEEENADFVKYDNNAFIMKVGDFKINPNTIYGDTISGIIFTNPKYIETNLAGNVIEQNGNLKIEIKNGETLDLVIPNKPSIAVVANKQNYGNGINKKIFEFGETVIEGQTGGKSKVRLSGYVSLQTTNDNDFTEFGAIKADNTVGKSKLTIGDNIEEFNTVNMESKFSLHEFEMKSGKIIVHLDQTNKDRDLFQWAGDYKTLSNGSIEKDTIVDEGTITFGHNVTMDIDGVNLDGDFVLVQPGNFNIVIPDIKSFVKYDDDRILETREIVKCSKADGLIAKLGAYKGDKLYNNLVKEAKLPEIDAKILQSSIEDVVYFNNSSNTNFDDFSKNIYKLSKNIFKKNESREPIIMIINHVQKPNSDSANVGAVGTVGLSSIKLASDILNDRMLNFTVPIGYVDSNMVILADAGGNFYNKKTSYPIELFTKVNLGFGKLKTSDGDRKISNYGFLAGGDFGLLENKMKIGTSIMFDYSNLNGLYRNSNIKSIVVSLYSKYDIFELKNKDILYTYGILSYSHTWESEEAKFMNFKNSSNKTANIIATDVLTGYKFDNIGIIPELGFGFIYGKQGNYVDNIGQNISSRDSIILSLKNNLRYNFPIKYLYDNIRIGFKLGLSYDILSIGDDGFDVKTPSGLKYHIKDVEGMDKLSFNYGTDFSYNLNNNSKISFSYEGIVTKNLFNNRFSFEFRYNFK